jgi:ATP synthase protein I
VVGNFSSTALKHLRRRGRKMKKETIEMYKELAYYSSLGISVALSIFIGLFIGLFLDKWLDTKPVFMFIFLGVGIAAGFRNLYLASKKTKKM